jgi:hypothetical protein
LQLVLYPKKPLTHTRPLHTHTQMSDNTTCVFRVRHWIHIIRRLEQEGSQVPRFDLASLDALYPRRELVQASVFMRRAFNTTVRKEVERLQSLASASSLDESTPQHVWELDKDNATSVLFPLTSWRSYVEIIWNSMQVGERTMLRYLVDHVIHRYLQKATADNPSSYEVYTNLCQDLRNIVSMHEKGRGKVKTISDLSPEYLLEVLPSSRSPQPSFNEVAWDAFRTLFEDDIPKNEPSVASALQKVGVCLQRLEDAVIKYAPNTVVTTLTTLNLMPCSGKNQLSLIGDDIGARGLVDGMIESSLAIRYLLVPYLTYAREVVEYKGILPINKTIHSQHWKTADPSGIWKLYFELVDFRLSCKDVIPLGRGVFPVHMPYTRESRRANLSVATGSSSSNARKSRQDHEDTSSSDEDMAHSQSRSIDIRPTRAVSQKRYYIESSSSSEEEADSSSSSDEEEKRAPKRALSKINAPIEPSSSTPATVQYEVEAIVDKKKGARGKVFYLVKWTGFDAASNSWEPLSKLAAAQDAIAAYESRNVTSTAPSYASTSSSSAADADSYLPRLPVVGDETYRVPTYEEYVANRTRSGIKSKTLFLSKSEYNSVISDAGELCTGSLRSGLGKLNEYGDKDCFTELSQEQEELLIFPDNMNRLEWFYCQRLHVAEAKVLQSRGVDVVDGNGTSDRLRYEIEFHPLNEIVNKDVTQIRQGSPHSAAVKGTLVAVTRFYLTMEMGVKVLVGYIEMALVPKKCIFLLKYLNKMTIDVNSPVAHWPRVLFPHLRTRGLGAGLLHHIMPLLANLNGGTTRIVLVVWSLRDNTKWIKDETGNRVPEADGTLQVNTKQLRDHYMSIGFESMKMRSANASMVTEYGTGYMTATIDRVGSAISKLPYFRQLKSLLDTLEVNDTPSSELKEKLKNDRESVGWGNQQRPSTNKRERKKPRLHAPQGLGGRPQMLY